MDMGTNIPIKKLEISIMQKCNIHVICWGR